MFYHLDTWDTVKKLNLFTGPFGAKRQYPAANSIHFLLAIKPSDGLLALA